MFKRPHRSTGPTRRIVTVLAAITALMIPAVAFANPAAAAGRDGVCDSGEFCYYYNSNTAGSVSDFTSSVADYGTTQPSCYDFKGAGTGQGVCVKNNAASVWNRSTSTVRVYFNSNYGGHYQDFSPGASGNLDATLKNNNAAHQFLTSTPPPPPPPPSGNLGTAVAAAATAELNNAAHNRESGGYNCNFYSAQLGVGSTCSNGWRSEEWCADFARWVWGHSGANVAGLNPGAFSFYKYGVAHNTWHTSGPRVGDAVVFNLNAAGGFASHVGLIVQTSPTVRMISGNAYGGGSSADRVAAGPLDSGVSGYASPVSAG